MQSTKASKTRETKTTMCNDHQSDGFDRVSDDLMLFIFDKVSDTKSLSCCRCVSKRFNSLVPHTENLFVKVDYTIPTGTDDATELTLSQVIKTFLQSIQDFIIWPKRIISLINSQSQPPCFSPSETLRGYERIKRLEIELPSVDLNLEEGTIMKWKAEFGKSLKRCIILVVSSVKINGVGNSTSIREETDDDVLKLRVAWMISSLIAASARHYVARDVIKGHTEIESLVLTDREREGTVLMENEDMKEFREGLDVEEDGEAQISSFGWGSRTVLPDLRMRMRHAEQIDLPGGVRISGATLAVVRPSEIDKRRTELECFMEDFSITKGLFEGVLGEAVGALFKTRGYLVEMNSF